MIQSPPRETSSGSALHNVFALYEIRSFIVVYTLTP
jgi:hypothetical protein